MEKGHGGKERGKKDTVKIYRERKIKEQREWKRRRQQKRNR